MISCQLALKLCSFNQPFHLLGANDTDPADCKLRPDEGLGAIGELSPNHIFSPATSVYTPLIRFLSDELGYDSNDIIPAPFDWRLAPSNIEIRDLFFTKLKQNIELNYHKNNRRIPVVVVTHSMGCLVFLYFLDWLRYINKPAGGYKKWVRTYIWSLIGYAVPLLGSPMSLKSVISGMCTFISAMYTYVRV